MPAGSPQRYAAFLRGINVGGNHLIKMTDLVTMFESMGLKNVKTFIASGNVVFDAAGSDAKAHAKKIEDYLRKKVGYDVKTMVRSVDELRALAKKDPFGVKADDITTLYVGFMSELPSKDAIKKLVAMNYDIETFEVKDNHVFAIRRMKGERPKKLVIESMEKTLGVPLTVRNWNTILKMLR